MSPFPNENKLYNQQTQGNSFRNCPVPEYPNDPTKFLNGAADFSEAGGSQVVLTASVQLTRAQLLALNDVAVQLVPAQGVGLAIIPVSMSISYNFVTTPYTVPLNAVLQISPSNVVGSLERQLAGTGGGFLNANSSQFNSNVVIPALQFTKAQVDNQALWISLFGASNLAVGDALVTIHLAYMVVPTS